MNMKTYNMKKNIKKQKNRIKCVYVYNFSVDYRAFDPCKNIDIHNYLMKKLHTK